MIINKQKTTYARTLRKSSTDMERILWSQLRGRQLLGVKFRRQQPFKGYIVDFISFEKRIIIEIDGGQHSNDSNKVDDEKRTAVFAKDGFIVLRFWDNELLDNIENVLETIRQQIIAIRYPSP